MNAKLLCICMILFCWATQADARLWPWPEDFEEVKGRRLGDRFISEEQGDSLFKQDLCFDCHDGSVLDNRDLWDPERFGHVVGVAPKKPLPKGIPLIGGELYCGSCHLPHGGLPGAREDVKKPFLRYENTNDVFCVACHEERATPGPQETSRNHSFLKRARKDTSTADPQAWKKIKALGGKVGKEGATRCQSCHNSHGAGSRSALIKNVDRSQLCSVCHHDIAKDYVGQSHPLHGENAWKVEGRPVTVECLTCHRVHEAPVPGMLLAEEGENLCLRCHKENALSEKDRHRDPKMREFLSANPGMNGAGLCGACHRTHRAEGGFLSRRTGGPSALDAGSAFCAGCHGSGKKALAENQIGPEYHFLGDWPKESVAGSRKPAGGRLPLLAKGGTLPDTSKKEVGTLLGCRTCHFMHRQPEGLSKEELSKNLRASASGGELCLQCHGDRKPILETNHNPLRLEKAALRDRYALKSDNPCSACHVVHGGRTADLYPSPLFTRAETDPKSAACIDCHGRQQGGDAKAESTVGAFTHPIGPWPAGKWKNPVRALDLPPPPKSLPLVDVPSGGAGQVGTAEKPGAVSCATCHRLHAATEEGPVSKKFLRPPLKQGDACVVCHRGQGMLAKTKHFIRDAKQVEAVERLFGTITEKHECTPCHRVHNAKGEGLWFTALPEPQNEFEEDERSRRCLVCHLHEPLKQIREENGHPIGRPMKTEYLPSAETRLALGRIEPDERGIRDVVVCATCHLNHGVENADGSISLFAGGGLPEGELCVACHREHFNIVGSPHDFRTRREGDFRPDEGRSLRFGVCAGCHANHNASIDQGLIAFYVEPPKAEGNPEDALCLHCHLDARVTKDRIVKFYVHPSGDKVREKLEEGSAGVQARFSDEDSGDKLGKASRTTRAGYEAIFKIRCTTCHDNHVWASRVSRREAILLGRTEMTSFLKGSSVAETFCANCHGVEALYRYLYFHQDRAFLEKILNK